MTGRHLVWIVLPLLALALVAQVERAYHRVRASQLLRQVELVSVRLAAGPAARPALQANLQILRRGEKLAPADVGIRMAIGSQYLLLGSPQAAISAYHEALALEERPEVHLNLGRAYQLAGDAKEARHHFRRAVRLEPHLRRQVRAEMGEPARR